MINYKDHTQFPGLRKKLYFLIVYNLRKYIKLILCFVYLMKRKTSGIGVNSQISRWNTLQPRVTAWQEMIATALSLRDRSMGSIKHTGVTPSTTTRESCPFSTRTVTRGRRSATPPERCSGRKFRTWTLLNRGVTRARPRPETPLRPCPRRVPKKKRSVFPLEYIAGGQK